MCWKTCVSFYALFIISLLLCEVREVLEILGSKGQCQISEAEVQVPKRQQQQRAQDKYEPNGVAARL